MLLQCIFYSSWNYWVLLALQLPQVALQLSLKALRSLFFSLSAAVIQQAWKLLEEILRVEELPVLSFDSSDLEASSLIQVFQKPET